MVGGRVAFAEEALLLAVALSLPVVAAAALASLVVALIQTTTQITDSTLGHLPRLLVVTAVLGAAGPWWGTQLVSFATRAFAFAP